MILAEGTTNWASPYDGVIDSPPQEDANELIWMNWNSLWVYYCSMSLRSKCMGLWSIFCKLLLPKQIKFHTAKYRAFSALIAMPSLLDMRCCNSIRQFVNLLLEHCKVHTESLVDSIWTSYNCVCVCVCVYVCVCVCVCVWEKERDTRITIHTIWPYQSINWVSFHWIVTRAHNFSITTVGSYVKTKFETEYILKLVFFLIPDVPPNCKYSKGNCGLTITNPKGYWTFIFGQVSRLHWHFTLLFSNNE
jgi:hypothetical protein